MRIISLIPSSTEIVCALGYKDQLVGRSHECDFPLGVEQLPVCSEPKFNPDMVIFIYNLIWWIAIVNISVALVNMLPMGIFDGGRMFYLTILGLTKSEKFAVLSYKVATWAILGVFFVLMFRWFISIF